MMKNVHDTYVYVQSCQAKIMDAGNNYINFKDDFSIRYFLLHKKGIRE